MFTSTFQILAHDTYPNTIVRPSPLFRYLHETANHQMLACKPSLRDFLNMGMSFILSRMTVNIYMPIYEYDHVAVESWPVPSKGATFTRCYRVWRGEEIVAEGTSVWALCEIATKKFLMVKDIDLSTFEYADLLPMAAQMRFSISPDAPLVCVGQHRVVFSEIDWNNHTNNTNYLDILCNHFPHVNDQFISCIKIKFLAESKLDDEFTICRAPVQTDVADANSYHFRTLLADGTVNVEAEITARPLS